MAENKNCNHNQKCRYTDGFYCEQCNKFFTEDSDVYRSSELLSTLWMVLHNVNVSLTREGKEKSKRIIKLLDAIGIGQKHENYEELISECETLLKEFNVHKNSANFILK